MTPEAKTKARELFQKFRLPVGSHIDDEGGEINDYRVSKGCAKLCALIDIQHQIELWDTVKEVYSDIDADESWLEKYNELLSVRESINKM